MHTPTAPSGFSAIPSERLFIMARSQNPEDTGTVANGFDYSNIPDNAIYMSVRGYNGILPMYTAAGSAGENAAINAGVKYYALRDAQQVAEKAEKAGKSRAEVAAEVNAFLAAYTPDKISEVEFQTVAQKRTSIAREMFADALERAGQKALAATARLPDGVVRDPATGGDMLDGYKVKYAEQIAAKLAEWAQEYTPPTTRDGTKSKAKEAAAPEGFSLDTL